VLEFLVTGEVDTLGESEVGQEIRQGLDIVESKLGFAGLAAVCPELMMA